MIQLMRDGLVDVVQLIFNLFDQEPAAQLLPVAAVAAPKEVAATRTETSFIVVEVVSIKNL